MLLCLRVQGEEEDPLTIPPAFHVPAPFGTNIGPPNPLFYAVRRPASIMSVLSPA